jgi:hypothetical protein
MPNRLLEATPEQVQLWLRFPPRGLRPRVPPRGFRSGPYLGLITTAPLDWTLHSAILAAGSALSRPRRSRSHPAGLQLAKSVGQLADPSDRPPVIPPRNRQTLPNTHKSGTAERRHLLIGPVRWHIGPVLCSPVEHRAGPQPRSYPARWNIGPVHPRSHPARWNSGSAPSPVPSRPGGTSGRSHPGSYLAQCPIGAVAPRVTAGRVRWVRWVRWVKWLRWAG